MLLTISSYAFLPQLIVICTLYGISAKNFDLTTPSLGDAATVAGNRYAVISLQLWLRLLNCLSPPLPVLSQSTQPLVSCLWSHLSNSYHANPLFSDSPSSPSASPPPSPTLASLPTTLSTTLLVPPAFSSSPCHSWGSQPHLLLL